MGEETGSAVGMCPLQNCIFFVGEWVVGLLVVVGSRFQFVGDGESVIRVVYCGMLKKMYAKEGEAPQLN